MLSQVLRFSIAASALMLAAASGTTQPAPQQQPYQQQQYPQGGQGQQQQPQQQGGFGQNQNSGSTDANDIVGWKITLDKSDSLAPAFASQARRYGCRTYNEDAWSLAAQCNEGVIVYKQENTEVLIGCAKITEQQCRDLFSRILNAE